MANRPKLTESVPGFAAMARHFGPDLATQRWSIAGAMTALFGGVAMQLLEPWPLKFVIDAVVQAAAGEEAGERLPMLLACAAVGYVAIVGVRATANYHEKVAFALIGNRVVSRIRTRLYRRLQSLPLSFHHNSRQGDLLVRMVGDIKLLRDVAVTALLPLAGGVLVLAGMMGVMLWLNWRLALVAIAVLPLFAFATMRTGRKIHQAARQQRQREGAVAAMAAEAISSVQVVQALSLESRFEDGFNSGDEQSAREEVKTRKLAARLSRTTDLVVATATAVVLWYGGRLAISGALSAGDLIVFLTYLKRGFRPLQNVAKYAARLSKATAAGERIIELLDVESEVQDAPHAVAAPPFSGAVRFESVEFGYDENRRVLDGFDAEIRSGEFVAIVGGSGAGKSTVLNLLTRFYQPTSGVIRIDGRDVNDWTIASVRSQTSVVLQDTVLFAANVYDNIAFGAPDATPEAIREAARLAEADQFISELPDGYETMLGERGANLSHGQRQRIAIARAVLRDAPLVLLDEPATALDQRNKNAVRQALRRLASGRTTLLVTHDLADARHADRVLVLEAGRVVEQGTPEQLVTKGGRFAELYDLQTTAAQQGDAADVAVR